MSDVQENATGCAILLGVIVFAVVKINGCVENARAAREAKIKQEQEARMAEVKRIEIARQAQERSDRIWAFTEKEDPALCNAYRRLKVELENQNKRIDELRDAFRKFGKSPDTDPDYKRICKMRDEMTSTLQTMRTKMEDAYLAFRKFEASPSRKDNAELYQKILQDGMREAEAAQRRFDEMRRNK